MSASQRNPNPLKLKPQGSQHKIPSNVVNLQRMPLLGKALFQRFCDNQAQTFLEFKKQQFIQMIIIANCFQFWVKTGRPQKDEIEQSRRLLLKMKKIQERVNKNRHSIPGMFIDLKNWILGSDSTLLKKLQKSLETTENQPQASLFLLEDQTELELTRTLMRER